MPDGIDIEDLEYETELVHFSELEDHPDNYKSHPDDPEHRRPDITRAREWLGYEPSVPLEDGIRRTVEYFDSILKQRQGVSHV